MRWTDNMNRMDKCILIVYLQTNISRHKIRYNDICARDNFSQYFVILSDDILNYWLFRIIVPFARQPAVGSSYYFVPRSIICSISNGTVQSPNVDDLKTYVGCWYVGERGMMRQFELFCSVTFIWVFRANNEGICCSIRVKDKKTFSDHSL